MAPPSDDGLPPPSESWKEGVASDGMSSANVVRSVCGMNDAWCSACVRRVEVEVEEVEEEVMGRFSVGVGGAVRSDGRDSCASSMAES
jgi:hypothetical protein